MKLHLYKVQLLYTGSTGTHFIIFTPNEPHEISTVFFYILSFHDFCEFLFAEDPE